MKMAEPFSFSQLLAPSHIRLFVFSTAGRNPIVKMMDIILTIPIAFFKPRSSTGGAEGFDTVRSVGEVFRQPPETLR